MKYNVDLVLKNNKGVCNITVDADHPKDALCKVMSSIHAVSTSAAAAKDSFPFILAERQSVINDPHSKMDTVMVAIDHIAFFRVR